jgi:hypothetical protein
MRGTDGMITEEVVAAVLAAVLIERSSLGDRTARQLRNQTAHGDVAEATQAWRRRADENSEQHRKSPTGQNCTVILTDLVAFGSRARTDEDRSLIRESLFDMTRTALQGIPVWSRKHSGPFSGSISIGVCWPAKWLRCARAGRMV